MPKNIDFVNILLYKHNMREVTFQPLKEDDYESDSRFCEFTLPIATLSANAQAHIRTSVIAALRDVFGHCNNIQCACEGDRLVVFRIRRDLEALVSSIRESPPASQINGVIVATLKSVLGITSEPQPRDPHPSPPNFTDDRADAYMRISRAPQRRCALVRAWKWMTGTAAQERARELSDAKSTLADLYAKGKDAHIFLESLNVRSWLQQPEIRRKFELLGDEAPAPVTNKLQEYKSAKWLVIRPDARQTCPCIIADKEKKGERINFTLYVVGIDGGKLQVTYKTRAGMQASLALDPKGATSEDVHSVQGLQILWQQQEKCAPSWRITPNDGCLLFLHERKIRHGKGMIAGW